jgi:hypothetical protein
MAGEEAIRRKHDLLAAEMHHYFWDICPELTARWKEAMLRGLRLSCGSWPVGYRNLRTSTYIRERSAFA